MHNGPRIIHFLSNEPLNTLSSFSSGIEEAPSVFSCASPIKIEMHDQAVARRSLGQRDSGLFIQKPICIARIYLLWHFVYIKTLCGFSAAVFCFCFFVNVFL